MATIVVVMLVAAGLSVISTPAVAAHNAGLLDLDAGTVGGADVQDADPSTDPPFDWASLFGCGNAAPPICSGPAPVDSPQLVVAGFAKDYKGIGPGSGGGLPWDTSDDTHFGSAGKDVDDSDTWTCKQVSNAGNKEDILNAYVAMFEDDDGHLMLFLGSERDNGPGTTFMGFWIFQNQVGCAPPPLGFGEAFFSSPHTVGDILILGNLTGGGGTSTVRMFRWTASDTLESVDLNPVAPGKQNGFNCDDALNPVADNGCGMFNTASRTTPWGPRTGAVTGDDAGGGSLEPNTLFEAGIDLTITLGLTPTTAACFQSFLAETRSSASKTADLKDYASSTFESCDARISIGPQDADNDAGTDHTFTITVEKLLAGADDFAPADGVLVTASIDSGPGSFVGGDTCTTDLLGQCTVTIHSDVAGTTMVSASATVTIGSSDFPVQTNGEDGSSGPATKEFHHVPSTTTTTPGSGGEILIGDTITDSVVVTGGVAGVTPQGTVSFFVCAEGVVPCTTGGDDLGTKTLDGAGTAESDVFTPATPGHYCFRGEYSGDATYLASADASEGECFFVRFVESGLDKDVRVLPGGAFGDTADAAPGDQLEYRLSYTNSGDATAHGVTISDEVPDFTTFVSCTDGCSNSGTGPGSVLDWTLGDVGPGATVDVFFVVQLDATFAESTTTTDNVATTDTDEEAPTDSDEVVVTVHAPPDSELHKSVANVDTGESGTSVPASAGDTIEYTLEYHNHGTGPAHGVVITEEVPDFSTFVSCTAGCTVTGDGSPGTALSWDIGTVAAGGTAIVSFQVVLDATFEQSSTTIPNTATVTTDEEGSQDSNPAEVTVTAPSDADLAKAVRNVDTGSAFATHADAGPGDTIEYRLTFTNDGTGPAHGVVITEEVPDFSTFLSCDTGCVLAGAGGPGSVLTWTIGTVAAQSTVVVTFQVTLDATFEQSTTSIVNVASFSTDEEGPGDSNSADVTVDAPPDSSLAKAVRNASTGGAFADSATAVPGDTIEYRLTYTNSGTGPAHDATITEEVPDFSTFSSCTAGCTTSGTSPGSTIEWDLGTVPAQTTVVVTFQVVLDAAFAETTTVIPNTATVTTTEEGPEDSNPTEVTVTALPESTLDKAVRNLDGGDFADTASADPGDTLEYRLVYNNDGSGPAHNVVVSEEVPEFTAFLSCTAGCVITGTAPGDLITWTMGDVAAGGQVTVTFQVQVDATFDTNTATIDNVATFSNDEEGDGVSDEVVVDVTAPPDSELHKSATNLDTGESGTAVAASPGDTIEYTLEYHNHGTGPADGVTITEEVPDRSRFVSCTDGCVVTGNGSPGSVITWTIGTVGAFGSRTVSFQVELDATFPSGDTVIPNTATVTTDQEGDTDSNEVTVTVSAAPDLRLVKSADRTEARPGDLVTYTLDYSNDGDGNATGVVITEELPGGTAFDSCSDDCQVDGSTVTWDIGDVPAGTGGSVTLTVEVVAQVSCEICNVATISSPDQDGGTPVPSNQVCFAVGPDPSAANASGSALALHIDEDVVELIERTDSAVSSGVAGPGADSQSGTPGSPIPSEVDVPGVAHADIMATSSSSEVLEDPAQASATSTAETANVDVLGGLVTARTVRAIATATATGGSVGWSAAGSTFKDLRVMGVATDDVAPNTEIGLPASVFGPGSFVRLNWQEVSTTTPDGLTGGTYAADLTVTMIWVHVADAVLVVAGAQPVEVIVSQASVHVDFPQTPVCEAGPLQAVSGHAFVLGVHTAPDLVPVTYTASSIPPTGGDSGAALDDAAPDDGTAAATTTSSGSTGTIDPGVSSQAASFAEAEHVCLVEEASVCTIEATGVRTDVSATADGAGASSTGTTTLVSLIVNGMDVCGTAGIGGTCAPAPNTVIDVPGVLTIVLNEQVPDAGPAGTTGLTVRAIHVIQFGALTKDVVVAESHADATFA